MFDHLPAGCGTSAASFGTRRHVVIRECLFALSGTGVARLGTCFTSGDGQDAMAGREPRSCRTELATIQAQTHRRDVFLLAGTYQLGTVAEAEFTCQRATGANFGAFVELARDMAFAVIPIIARQPAANGFLAGSVVSKRRSGKGENSRG